MKLNYNKIGFAATVFVTLALIKHVDAVAEHYELCAEAFDPKKHLMVNVNKKSKPLIEWVPPEGETFYFTIAQDFSWVKLQGTLKKRTGPNQDKYLFLDYTFSNSCPIDSCFCASQEFIDFTNANSVNHPNYQLTQKFCTPNIVNNPEINTMGLEWCPHCEDDQCEKARKKENAPEPIWENWTFYKESSGSMTGPGVELFRNSVHKQYPLAVNASVLSCTPYIENLPLAQMYCTNYTDPSDGKGFGANAKSQDCGFAVWFNCEEDIAALNAQDPNPPFQGHIADINLKIVPCPAPTPQPSTAPSELLTCLDPPYPPDIDCCGLFCFNTQRQQCRDIYQELNDANCIVGFTPENDTIIFS